jgi:DNA-binding NtrC family response regulator
MAAQENLLRTILLVEDDALLRWNAAEIAEDAGFAVLQAADADAALKIIGEHEEVGILFTDVHMPGSMNGVRLAHVVHERWPDVALIITSGEMRPQKAKIPDNGIFIPKPYTHQELTLALNEMVRRSTTH